MLFKHSSIYMLAKAIPGLMAFAALSLYTHLLTPDEYGLYTLIFTASIFLHNVIFNWLPAGTLRFWSKQEFSEETFISTLVSSYLKIITLLLLVALLVSAVFWNEPASNWVLSAFFLIVTMAVFTITQNLMTAQILPFKYALLTISYSILALCFGGYLALTGYGAIGVVTGIAIGFLLPTVFFSRDFIKKHKRKTFDKALFKKLLFYGLPLASVTLLEELTKSADRFMLASLQNKAQAGMYAVGYDLSGNSILLIMSAINLAAYPVIIKLLDTEGKEVALEYFSKYVVLLIGVSLPAVMGLIMVGPSLVHLVIGDEYQQAVILLLPWITSALLMMGLQATYFDLAFQLGHYTIGIVKISIIIGVVNIALNYWLIPIMGMKGAAIATLSSFVLGALLSAYLGRKHFKLPFPAKSFFKICLATLFMAFCLWWVKDLRGWGWLLVQLFTGIASYFIAVYSFNLLDIRETIKNRLQTV